MTLIAAAVAVAWAALLGAAYIARVTLRCGRRRAAAVVIAVYAGLGAAVLSWNGLDTAGILGVTGMLVPCLAAIGLIQLPRRVP